MPLNQQYAAIIRSAARAAGKRRKGGEAMKLKDQLILREVAGQYVIVPTGKRVREVTSIVYISSSAAYLWEYMKDHDFTREDLVQRIMEHYTGVTEEQAGADIDKYLKMLADNNILDDGVVRGRTFVRLPKELLDKLWPPGGRRSPAPTKREVRARA